ncbi:MAG TPA: fused MFS/spermidine synthase [Solirubrobacteraceae bacterium]|nr:fused MFS/spermidine synthase [Solirubrobacteraceae bacterium]
MTASSSMGERWSPRTVTADTGMALAEIVPEHGRPWRRTLRLDGEDASHVDLRDPLRIEWAYVRRLADAADALAPPRKPIDAFHVGGGAFTLPRYVAAARPGSRQEVAEVDRRLVALAREHLGLWPSPALRVRVGDGRAVLARRRPASADLVVVDAFVAMEVPEHLTTVEFAALARGVLRPRGWLAVNVVEPPPLGRPGPSRARPLAAALAAAFPHLAVVATRKVLRRRQGGNVVLLAAGGPLPLERLAARARRGPSPQVVVGGADSAAFAATAAARYDSG